MQRMPVASLRLLLLLVCIASHAWAADDYGDDDDYSEGMTAKEDASMVECMVFGTMCQFNIMNVVMALFFLAWNSMMSAAVLGPIIRMLVFGWRDGCRHFSCILCIFPHWYVGVLVPLFVGGLLSGSVAIVLPYGYNGIRMLNMALKEKKHADASEASQIKMDVLEALKLAESEVRFANHTDDVSSALESMTEALIGIRLLNGRSIFSKEGFAEKEAEKDIESGGKAKDAEADKDPTTDPTDEPTLERSKSTFSKLSRTMSGVNHFSTGQRTRS
eukprot:TRINITY_DN20744_c0_g1_i1.p1 TRINITY_DN20744_c0_g1~~TRINITY_DN20744_c0_g1_i1.p1  ORF type:complete len:274 (-),score=31.37 TRINITY_DN20744_c0_g1_i1:357-1178(-)